MAAIVDFHIHLYRGYSLTDALSSAQQNSCRRFGETALASPHVWCLTERQGQHWFRDLIHASDSSISDKIPESWTVSPTEDGLALRIDLQPVPLYLVAGRQIVTSERLELLCLTADLEIEDGIPIRHGVEKIIDAGAIPMVPWSPGKWMGKRGKILEVLLEEKRGVYLGDTAIRPGRRWGQKHFSLVKEQGLPVLPGSDPLPAKGEDNCFHRLSAEVDIPCNNPASELRTWVKKHDRLNYADSGEGLFSMVKRMANMKLNKIEV